MNYTVQLFKNGKTYNITISNDNFNMNDGTSFHDVTVVIDNGLLEDIKEELIEFLNKSKLYYFGLNLSLNGLDNGIKISDNVFFDKGVYYINKKATNVYDQYGNIIELYREYVWKKHLYEYEKKIENEQNDIKLNINNKISNIKEQNDDFYEKLETFYFNLKIVLIVLLIIISCICIFIFREKLQLINISE
jgi:hypothetical protein